MVHVHKVVKTANIWNIEIVDLVEEVVVSIHGMQRHRKVKSMFRYPCGMHATHMWCTCDIHVLMTQTCCTYNIHVHETYIKYPGAR